MTPQPPARAQDDEEAAVSHAAAGPDGQLGTVSVNPLSPSPTLTARRTLGDVEGWGRSGTANLELARGLLSFPCL